MGLVRSGFRGDLYQRQKKHAKGDVEWEAALRKGSPTGRAPVANACMELVGEQTPLALTSHDASSAAWASASRVYEYVWSLGLTGRQIGWMNELNPADAVLIQLIVSAATRRYCAREVFATLEYLPPSRSLSEPSGYLDYIKAMVPVAGKLAGELPGVGVATSIASAFVNAIPSKSKSGDSKWFLNRFDLEPSGADAAGPASMSSPFGIEWHISQGLIYETGSRLTGRLGMIFLDAPMDGSGPEASEGEHVMRLAGRFGIRTGSDDDWEPHSMLPISGDDHLTLKLHPVAADARSTDRAVQGAQPSLSLARGAEASSRG